MKVELLTSSALRPGSESEERASAGDSPDGVETPANLQFATTYVVDDTIAIDAGSLGIAPIERQRRVRHIFLTHTHMDHISSLPIFLENIYAFEDPTVTVYGSKATLDTLQSDLFNDRVWPDFIRLSEGRRPFLALQTIEPGDTVTIDDVEIRALSVDHVVPTQAYIVSGSKSDVIFCGDSGPVDDLWKTANELEHLSGVFLECSFPDEEHELADIAKHLTPKTFHQEVEKVSRDARFFAVHIKSMFYAKIVAQLEALNSPRIEICEPGRRYEL